jgi:hypothetical protein
MKKILFLIGAFMSSGFLFAQPTNGLVGYFSLNGNTTNAGSATITATPFNTSYTFNGAGAPNRAVQFAGAINSYIGIVDNGNLDFTGDFSVSFSVRLASTATSQGLIDNGLNYGGYGLYYLSSDNTLRFNYKNGTIGAIGALPVNQWKAVCAVKSGTSMLLYINGVQVASGTQGSTAISYPYAPVIGQLYFSPNNYVPISNGSRIDEMRFYNRALSAAEVSSLVSSALPLHLLEFEGRTSDAIGLLNWKTADELNTHSFDVERSTDGKTYSVIGNVTAFNTPGNHAYHYTDNNISSLTTSVIYYRIKQIDIDGHFTYSRIIALPINKNKNILLFYPNPVVNEANLTLTVNARQLVQGRIIDNAGKIVQQQQWNLSPGSTSVSLNLGTLANGIYYLELKGETFNERRQFVKQ